MVILGKAAYSIEACGRRAVEHRQRAFALTKRPFVLAKVGIRRPTSGG